MPASAWQLPVVTVYDFFSYATCYALANDRVRPKEVIVFYTM